MACLYTRHHDGRLRQKHLEKIITSESDWVVPYIVYLAGEYVVEIAEVVHAALSQLDADDPRRDAYKRFVRDNPALMDLVEARAMSYWSCYHRSRFPRRAASPNREDYPGLATVRILRSLGGAE